MRPARGPTAEEVAQRRADTYGISLVPLAEAQKESSEKLLAGWIMLNDSCPISNYPLLKDPKSGKIWSVRCQMEVNPDSNGGETASEQDTNTDTRASSKSDIPSSSGSSFANSNLQTERIAQKLVQGWTLTSEICPISNGCPVLVDPSSKRRWSPATGEYLDGDDGNSGVTSKSANAKSHASSPVDSLNQKLEAKPLEALTSSMGVSSQSGQTQVKRHEVPPMNVLTKRINERLLKRWTMLAEECPVTHACPLLREPDTNRLYSAALDEFVDAQKPEQPPVQKAPEPITKESNNGDDYDIEYNNPLFKPAEDDSEQQAKRLSQRLVQGWVMLDEECPVTGRCPLMEEPNSGRKYSAALDKFLDEFYDEDIEIPEKTAPMAPVRNTQSAVKLEEDSDDEVDGSQFHVGSWTQSAMNELDDDLDGIDDHHVVSRDSMPVSALAKQTSGKSKASASGHRVRFHDNPVHGDEDDDNLSTKSVESGVSLNGETKDELRRAEAVVRSKLREARDALARIEVTMDADPHTIQTCENLVRLVGTCVNTLRQVSMS